MQECIISTRKINTWTESPTIFHRMNRKSNEEMSESWRNALGLRNVGVRNPPPNILKRHKLQSGPSSEYRVCEGNKEDEVENSIFEPCLEVDGLLFPALRTHRVWYPFLVHPLPTNTATSLLPKIFELLLCLEALGDLFLSRFEPVFPKQGRTQVRCKDSFG